MKKLALIAVTSLFLVQSIGACVTVNVNFPESAVQKATDDYVRELYRAKERGQNKDATKAVQTPSPSHTMMSFFITEAWAQAEAFSVHSEKASSIQQKLAAQIDDVIAQKRAGTIGERNDGLLEARNIDDSKPLLKKKVDKLVDSENSLRESLYREVVSANRLGSAHLKNVQKSFARSWQAESPSGTWVQDADGHWSQKP